MPVTYKTLDPGIGILEIDRPAVCNALDWNSMKQFGEIIESAHQDKTLRAMIVTGYGRMFIAGGDLKELSLYPSMEDGHRLSGEMSRTLQRLEALPIPTIAAINGPARGGGVEISLACDLRVMSSEADLGFMQIRLGLTPGWGAGQRLLRLVGYSRAFELLVTGTILDASKAFDLGLANRLAPPGEALSAALKLGREIAGYSQEGVCAIKQLLRAGTLLPGQAGAVLEHQLFPPLWASEEHRQAVDRFLNPS